MVLFMLMIIYQLMSTFKSVMAELPLQAIYFLFPLSPPQKNHLLLHLSILISHKPSITILGKNVTNHYEERLMEDALPSTYCRINFTMLS